MFLYGFFISFLFNIILIIIFFKILNIELNIYNIGFIIILLIIIDYLFVLIYKYRNNNIYSEKNQLGGGILSQLDWIIIIIVLTIGFGLGLIFFLFFLKSLFSKKERSNSTTSEQGFTHGWRE